MNAHIGRCAVDARPFAERIPEAVADRVLDAQRGELEALERALLRRQIDAQRALEREVARPIERLGRAVDVFLAAIPEVADQPKYPRHHPRPETGPLTHVPAAAAGNAAGHFGKLAGAERTQLLQQQILKSPRRGGEERFRTA